MQMADKNEKVGFFGSIKNFFGGFANALETSRAR